MQDIMRLRNCLSLIHGHYHEMVQSINDRDQKWLDESIDLMWEDLIRLELANDVQKKRREG